MVTTIRKQNRTLDVPLAMAKLSSGWLETMTSAAHVVDARLSIIAAAWLNPLTADISESSRMVSEKTDAFGRPVGRKRPSERRTRFRGNARALGKLAGGQFLEFAEWSGIFDRNLEIPATPLCSTGVVAQLGMPAELPACLDVAILPNIAGDIYRATAIILEDERTRELANKTSLEQRLAHEGVSWDWQDTTGELALCLSRAATLADLIVVNRGLDDLLAPNTLDVASLLLKETETPVLAVPDSTRSLNVTGHALVAWDGSQAASAALRASVPLLALAGP